MKKYIILSLAAAALIAGSGIAFSEKADTPAPTNTIGANVPPKHKGSLDNVEVSFSEDILPLLKWRCSGCHQKGGIGYEKSALDLTTYEGVMKGTKFGPMIIPGDPDSSNLMMLVDWRVKPEIHMPYGKKQLSYCDRAAIRTWIRQGAKNN